MNKPILNVSVTASTADDKPMDLETELRKTIITGPAELRSVLLMSIEKVISGQMNVPQANAVVGLSAEVHKSIRQQYDMTVYAVENLGMRNGTNILAIESATDIEDPDEDE
jgi:hypothetical protein